jgi:hypothetical protein
MKTWIQRKHLLLFFISMTSICGAATSPAGRYVKFYEAGVRGIRFVMPGTNCVPSAQQTCITLDALGNGSFSDLEVTNFTVRASPGRSTLCAHHTESLSYAFMRRATSGEGLSSFRFTYRYEIQSAVLNNPSLILPQTGLPFNGKISLPYAVAGSFIDQGYLGPQQRVQRGRKTGLLDCGTLLNHAMLTILYGLDSATAQEVMSQPITIRMYVSGALEATDGANYTLFLHTMGD